MAFLLPKFTSIRRHTHSGKSVWPPGKSLSSGDTITAAITIRNDLPYDSSVRVNFWLGTQWPDSRVTEAGFSKRTVTINAKGKKASTQAEVSLSVPSRRANFYFTLTVESQIGSNWVQTDAWSWTPTFTNQPEQDAGKPSNLLWPLKIPEKVELTQRFGDEWIKRGGDGEWKLHSGVDLAVPGGTPFRASQAGVVKVAYTDTSNSGLGFITIEHKDSKKNLYTTQYRHVVPSVVTGQTVTRGKEIGKTDATEGHLHFGLRLAAYSDNAGYSSFADRGALPQTRNIYSADELVDKDDRPSPQFPEYFMNPLGFFKNVQNLIFER